MPYQQPVELLGLLSRLQRGGSAGGGAMMVNKVKTASVTTWKTTSGQSAAERGDEDGVDHDLESAA